MAVPVPASRALSSSQLETLAEHGVKRTAQVDDVLYTVGDASYPFIAIEEGEVAILDAAGNEIVRHGPSGFLGELNLLSGQTVFVSAVVKQPLRYIEVERAELRKLLFDDAPLSDLLLSAFIERREALQRVEGIGVEIIGPRSSDATMRMLGFLRAVEAHRTLRDHLLPELRRQDARRCVARSFDVCGWDVRIAHAAATSEGNCCARRRSGNWEHPEDAPSHSVPLCRG